MALYTSFSIYVTYVINLGRRLRHKKRNHRNFCKNVLNKVFLRGGIKSGTEAEVGRIYDYSYCPLFYFKSATSPLKTIRGKEMIK